MKKASKKPLALKRDTLKTLTELPDTAYGHVVGGAAAADQSKDERCAAAVRKQREP